MDAMKFDQKAAERWAKIRTKGRTRFVWLRGVLGWGLPVAVSWPTLMGMMNGWGRFYFQLPFALLLFPIGGYFWAAWMWRWCDSKYQEATWGDGLSQEDIKQSQ